MGIKFGNEAKSSIKGLRSFYVSSNHNISKKVKKSAINKTASRLVKGGK